MWDQGRMKERQEPLAGQSGGSRISFLLNVTGQEIILNAQTSTIKDKAVFYFILCNRLLFSPKSCGIYRGKCHLHMCGLDSQSSMCQTCKAYREWVGSVPLLRIGHNAEFTVIVVDPSSCIGGSVV